MLKGAILQTPCEAQVNVLPARLLLQLVRHGANFQGGRGGGVKQEDGSEHVARNRGQPACSWRPAFAETGHGRQHASMCREARWGA